MLTIYTTKNTARIEYVCKYIFDLQLHIPYHITTDISTFLQLDTEKLNYSSKRLHQTEIFIYSAGLLNDCYNIIARNEIHAVHLDQHVLFPVSDKTSEFSFDIFSAIFYMLSRYEEYLHFKPDLHDRFPSSESLASKKGFLSQPVVDIWVAAIQDLLERKYGFEKIQRSFDIQPTFDLDRGYSYQHRSIVSIGKTILGSLLKGNISQALLKWKIWNQIESDPYDTLEFILDSVRQSKSQLPIFFILTGFHNKYDKTDFQHNNDYRENLQRLSSNFPLGIHPSYISNYSLKKLKIEIQLLAEVSHQSVHRSRQHFLKLQFPETYTNLITCGIHHDYTMGFADAVGFRAGTSKPFLWYNLTAERTTDLMIHPFVIMDVTLKKYLALNPNSAIKLGNTLKNTIKTHGGIFTFIWHNSSFCKEEGWDNWDKVFSSLLAD